MDTTEEKKQAKAEAAQAKADDKLAQTPSPAVLRASQGDWAVSNNPSPEEQQAEKDRQDAIGRVAAR